MAEFVPSVGLRDLAALLVLGDRVAALVDNLPVLLEIAVDVAHKFLSEVELREHVRAVYLERFYLVADFEGVCKRFRMVWEYRRHLLLRLEVLLLGVAQTLFVVDISVGGDADEAVVNRSVFLAYEMYVIGSYYLDAHLPGQFEYLCICFLLSGSHAVKIGLRLLRQTFYLRAVVHYLKVVVVTEYPLVPLYCLARGVNVSAEYGLRDLAGKTGGTADEVLVILFYYLV